MNGSGPYAYRVEYVGDDEHDWEYLGPVGKVDPGNLSREEIAALREEGFALSRYRDGQESEVYKRAIANTLRDELTERWGESVLAATDDRRSTTIKLAEDAPRAAKRKLAGTAEDMQQEVKGYGQSPLSAVEKKKIDFSEGRANTFHARASKAGMLEYVNDWTSVYDERLTVEENISRAKSNARGGNMTAAADGADTEDGPGEDGTSFAQARGEMEKRAVQGAKEGYEEAVSELRETFGWTEDEIQEVAG